MAEVTFDFTGKNYMVVGATSGLGEQVHHDLVDAHANVLAVGRNETKLQALREQWPTTETCRADVTKTTTEDWKNMIASFVAAHGKLDGAVYTAGLSVASSLSYYDEEEAKTNMETNLWAAVRCLQVVSKKRYSNDGASTVWLSSIAGHTGGRGMFAYSAAKAAVRVAAYSLAHDLAKRGQRLNTLSPAWVTTPMTTHSLLAQNEEKMTEMRDHYLLGIGVPQDVSSMALFLLSDRARWITGTDFILDGGLMRGAWR